MGFNHILKYIYIWFQKSYLNYFLPMNKCDSCSSLLQGSFSWLNRRFKRSDSTCLKSIDKYKPSQWCFAHWNLQAGQALVRFSRRTATWAPSDLLVSKEKSRGVHGSVSWAPNRPENPCLEGLGGPLTVQGSEHWSDWVTEYVSL